MRVHFALHSYWYFRNIAPVIEEIGRRGHRIDLSVTEEAGLSDAETRLAALCDAYRVDPRVVEPRTDGWREIADGLRAGIDYLFFLGPDFEKTSYIRRRRKIEAPPLLLRETRRLHLRHGIRRRAALWFLQRIEERLPPHPALVAMLKAERPDVLVISPLLGPDVWQYEYLLAAKHAGVPTLFMVHSWDNLTSKSLIRLQPERMAVWNGIQRDQAVRLHGYPEHRVTVTGAQNFDDWFLMKPSVDRETLCRMYGLHPGRPILFYLASALYFFKRLPEEDFVQRWVRAVRAAPEQDVANASIVIRPHPKRTAAMVAMADAGPEGVVVTPREGENPVSPESRQAFFDILYHADAVVGLNTSAMIEAAVLEKPVHTVLAPEHWVSQGDTFHFSYLTDPVDGLLMTARSLDEHIRLLGDTLRNPEIARARTRRFLGRFVRPHGLDRPVVPLVADAVEEAGRLRVSRPKLWGLGRDQAHEWLRNAWRENTAIAEAEAGRVIGMEQWFDGRMVLHDVQEALDGRDAC